ncbi:MAG: hypothetical protein ACI9SG_002726 [Maribacter sp.]|jgi:hypothetical protein
MHFIAGQYREKIYALVYEAIENGTPWDVEIQMKTGKGNIYGYALRNKENL